MIFLAIFSAIIFVFFGLVILRGAPYVPTHKKVLQEVFDSVELKKGDLVVDLGSGDGVFLKIAAQKGYRAIGYEINPFLCLVSYLRCWRYKKLVKIYWKDFWSAELPAETKLVYVFLADVFMDKLKNKISGEAMRIGKPLTLVSNGFKIKDLKPIQTLKAINIYKIG